APAPTAAPAPADELAALDAARRPLRDPVVLARALGACRPDPGACPTVARNEPLDVAVGYVRPFYITDLLSNSQYEIEAELRYAGPVALMYVERGVGYSQGDLERAARAFEQEIYPRTREVFGSEAQPGVDGDPRITILNARSPSGGVLGYFSSQDALPRQVNRFSNEREMFFMNIELLDFAGPGYLDTLAHEFQHMIHHNEGPGSPVWFNEGASQLSEDLNGFVGAGLTTLFLSAPDVQLTHWAPLSGALPHYGASHLFMRYIYAQYAGEAQLRPLIQADAGNNLQAFVDLAARTRPDITSFSQIVADWAVANLIDSPTTGDGRYTYATGHGLPELLPARVQPRELFPGAAADTVAQFGADYYALPAGAAVAFRGAPTVPLAAELPRGRYAWWSGRSDDSFATLTRAFDLRGLGAATLRFSAWYEIENDYDYAFVTVSTDGGVTWETLPGAHTTADDPQGVNFGHGYTGVSGQPGLGVEDGVRGTWVEETMDLAPYVGQEILLRFWQINDQGFNAPGLLVDEIGIPELGYSDDVESGDGGWQAEGFVRVDGDLPQRWELRLVRAAPDGGLSVEPLAADETGAAAATLAPDERGILVVVGATPHTSERAYYEVSVQ
ncbi:MAG TPA: immune inhibitor A, partial [Chloroflexaceae bacterium]|nr:immune inhibitor A [Chloroflexaceae bacterium]